jgi:monovalent cation/hydrogen antiporter
LTPLETIFVLLFVAVLLVGFAQSIRIPYPIALVIGGMFIGFIPNLPPMYLDPKTILFIVLPPMLYYASVGISFREFRRNWVNIFSLALGLVAFTTLVIGVLFKWMFPQYSWALAFAFGAIVSPPDAVSATAILRRFAISPRLDYLLEGESLVNDASAIVLYKIAVTALLSGTFSLMEGGIEFIREVSVGVLTGLTLGYLMQIFSRRYLEPVLGVIFSFTIPFSTYLVANLFGGSGVLAVVVTGVLGARILLMHRSSLRRVLGFANWDVLIVLLNCFVFILIGLQLRIISQTMTKEQLLLYTGYAFLTAFVMMLVRMFWVYAHAAAAYLEAQID